VLPFAPTLHLCHRNSNRSRGQVHVLALVLGTALMPLGLELLVDRGAEDLDRIPPGQQLLHEVEVVEADELEKLFLDLLVGFAPDYDVQEVGVGVRCV